MKEEIMHVIADYVSAYENYKETIKDRKILSRLTSIYNQLLSIAEDNAHDYYKFMKNYEKKKIQNRFGVEIKKCRKEIDKII